MKGLPSIPFLLIILFGTPSCADLQKGWDAYGSGDYDTAVKEFEPLAERGNVDAQFILGFMYASGEGVAQDYKAAIKWYKLAAEQEHDKAQYNLGVMYYEGQGVTQDYKAAIEWYKLAAEHGHTSSLYNLGYMYFSGKGVIQDYTRAHMWLNIAASQGDEDAVENRNRIEKEMTPTDLSKARQLAEECVAKYYKGCWI